MYISYKQLHDVAILKVSNCVKATQPGKWLRWRCRQCRCKHLFSYHCVHPLKHRSQSHTEGATQWCPRDDPSARQLVQQHRRMLMLGHSCSGRIPLVQGLIWAGGRWEGVTEWGGCSRGGPAWGGGGDLDVADFGYMVCLDLCQLYS